MNLLRKILILTVALTVVLGAVAAPRTLAAEYVVYSVFKPIDLGNPGETPHKDYYVNMGTLQGVRVGSQLEVMRKTPTYDILNEKLYGDVTFPIARMKVVHVESNAAVCRVEKILPSATSPETGVRAVLVGDLVRLAR